MPLKIYQRPKGATYYLRGTVAGTSIHESTGTSNRRLADVVRVRRETELLERATLGIAATITFAEAALSYIEAGGSPRFLDKILLYAGQDTLLKDVNNAWVRDAAAEIYPDRAASTVDRQLVTPVSAVVNYAAEDDLCPPRKFRKRSKDRARVRWITPEEAETLIATIRDLQPHILRPVAIMLGGGARASEALGIERADLHVPTGEVWIDRTKNGDRARRLRLPRRALDLVVAGGIPDEGPICRTPRGRPYVLAQYRGGQIKGAFETCAAKAGLDPREVTPHVLRHTWATWYFAATKDFGALMDLGGWKSANMANRYRKLAPEDLGARLRAHGWNFARDDFGPREVAPIATAKRHSGSGPA